jgi:TonB dependent receptor/Carboxypeptidase regulatory-like domain/TonB-dependent Receptor Plug Domain
VVRDGQSGETLIEAPVIVVGRGTRTLTDYEGRFAFDLPPGRYALRSYYDLYQPARVEDVVVGTSDCTRIDIALSMDTSTAEEVVIEVRAAAGSAASQLRMRRESAATQDAISSEEMRRAPDSTASEVARRVVGVTMRDDYLYVRGLGGRYVTVLMNGVALPQTDPDVPGVQLDVMPSGLLDSLMVQKTFTAFMPGDWAGGLVDLSTSTFPADFELRAGVSFGVNTATSFQSVVGAQSGGLDALGFDNGTRAIPEAARGVDVDDLPAEQRDGIAAQFPNSWPLRTRTALPNLGVSLGIGDTIEIAGHQLGYRILASYRIGDRPVADFVQSLRQQAAGEAPEVRESYSQAGSERYAQLGVLGTLSFELAAGHDITVNALLSQNSEDFAARQQGFSEALGANTDSSRASWLQRSLFFGQLLGVHRGLFASSTRLDWQLNTSVGERLQPDMRDLTYAREEDGRTRYVASPLSGSRFTSDLDDLTFGGGGGLTIPLGQVTLRAGGLLRYTERGLRIRRFNWLTRTRAPADGVYLPPSQLFSPENINTYLRIDETTSSRDGYDAQQQLTAAYLSLEWAPFDFLRFVGGIRGESFRQEVRTFDPRGEDPAQLAVARTDLDPLPSASVIAEVTSDVFIRAGYGGTVGRPLIRELAPFAFIDFLRRRTVTGQAGLGRTYIHNFDLRLEWFPSANEVLAISGFAKLFESPIEQVIASAEGDASYANIDGAENYGAEAEARINLGHIAREIDWISVGANVAIIYSRARLSSVQKAQATNDERPMAGQAPFVVNALIGIEPPNTNLQVNIFYNVLGPRLEDVGRIPFDDVYRQPLHALDVSMSWEFVPDFSLRFTAQNILFQRQELTQSGIVVLGINPGTQFSLGLSITN